MTCRFLATRRAVLQQLGAVLGGAAVGLPAIAECSRPEDRCGPALAGPLADLIRHPESAAVIGAAWLAGGGEACSTVELVHDLETRLGIADDAGHRDIRATDLVGLIRADFAAGDIVNVQGWILSRTEARICAVYAL